MSKKNLSKIKKLLTFISENIANETPLSEDFYNIIQDHPEYCIEVLELLPEYEKQQTNDSLIMACFHFIELCLVHLRLAHDYHQRWAEELLEQIQRKLNNLIQQHPVLSYWMPVINIFFDADIELKDYVKESYLQLLEMSQETEHDQHLLMQELLSENNDKSEFEIAELFFAQTNTLPNSYFPAFVSELLSYDLPKAINIAVLFLFHPQTNVRRTMLESSYEIFHNFLLPKESISRLIIMRQWLPMTEKKHIEVLLTSQRKKGAEFADFKVQKVQEILATEMDGSGAQALFFLIKHQNSYQAAGILIKRSVGIKDTWISPHLNRELAKKYAFQGLSDSITLRKVNNYYAESVISHHIACEQQHDAVPSIHLIKLQELLGYQLRVETLNFRQELAKLSNEIGGLNKQWVKKSLQRSGNWHKKYKFATTWFEENADIDRHVNQYCTFIEGKKYCQVDKAEEALFPSYFELRRQQWLEHFLWMSLWAKHQARYNEYLWKDCFVLALEIEKGRPLKDIPLMQTLCEQSILLSIDTMEIRKTHLS